MGKIIKHTLLTIPFIFVLSCAAFSDQVQRLQSVMIEDGISLEEAEVLSSEYFWRHISGCGMAGKPTDGGEFWLSI